MPAGASRFPSLPPVRTQSNKSTVRLSRTGSLSLGRDMHTRKKETLIAFILLCVLSVPFAVATLLRPNVAFISFLDASVLALCLPHIECLLFLTIVIGRAKRRSSFGMKGIHTSQLCLWF